MLHLTPATVEAAYETLLTTLPFRRWRLPAADDIEFRVGLHRAYDAYYERQDDRHWLTVSTRSRFCTTIAALTMTMAHEMIHMHLLDTCPRDRGHHNKRFQALAARVCKRHGFDIAAF